MTSIPLSDKAVIRLAARIALKGGTIEGIPAITRIAPTATTLNLWFSGRRLGLI